MPSFRETLSTREIRDVSTYVAQCIARGVIRPPSFGGRCGSRGVRDRISLRPSLLDAIDRRLRELAEVFHPRRV